MKRFVRWLQSLFAWRAVRATGVWVYLENTVTGRRKAIKTGGCYQPLDHEWLRDGDIVIGPRGRYIIGTEGEVWLG
jgi:hypothetical protein